MRSWPRPQVPVIPGTFPTLSLFDTSAGKVRPVNLLVDEPARMYVCGITPYDATHLGHAATYLTFDLIYRLFLDAGHKVEYVQNITDVDDPLFERAQRDGVDWQELGDSQIDLFRSDMEALSVIPPQHYIGAIESVDEVIEMVGKLLDIGAAYVVDADEYRDIYFDRNFTPDFGYESNYDAETMAEFFAERGGDPDRPGKRDPLDALLWRAARDGEPSWDAPFGAGRPGWHIECSAIAVNRLGMGFTVQGGGSDLIFPHHEYSAAHAEAVHGGRMADFYVHSAMIQLDGVKMSKSLGNLVFVSKLTAAGTDPSAIRLGVFAGHYREDRSWSDEVLRTATQRLATWRAAVASPQRPAAPAITELRAALANDLDTPTALTVVDQWAAPDSEQVSGAEGAAAADSPAAPEVTAADGEAMRAAVDALLGVKL
ncbi:cysteine--1-D-myo-inosityl 2-amino-2-deoxy-alpha-D-glucopyranoside ligase [Corynebacterium ulceribovis]|uniref:cysteine--1-D-myo-inosityl 2-amino-2-deoxy-alpha-D-glucopyranoside ligase n=1 Tax=Corynebacterium ulceribovis TaxID=487732 RepID=UPI000476BA6B|nr:cysteine--1-D-myo-inosityl 2-amino-2-deoxy-alpha-D-glucopyranoside ligase [Corynebacterium ulceribovis]